MPQSLDYSFDVWPISDGEAGTREALTLMAACVRGECPPDFSGWQDPFILKTAAYISLGHYGADSIPAIFQFCRDEISYLIHPPNVQQVQDAKRTLQMGTGDCVSKSVLLSTLLAARGVPSRFVAQAPDSEGYSHVYVQALNGGVWVNLDSIADGKAGRPLGGIGWAQPLPISGRELNWGIF